MRSRLEWPVPTSSSATRKPCRRAALQNASSCARSEIADSRISSATLVGESPASEHLAHQAIGAVRAELDERGVGVERERRRALGRASEL